MYVIDQNLVNPMSFRSCQNLFRNSNCSTFCGFGYSMNFAMLENWNGLKVKLGCNFFFCFVNLLISHDLDLLIFILIAEYMLILDFSGYNVGNVSPLQFFTDSVKRVFGSSYMILSSKNSNWVLINLSFNEWRDTIRAASRGVKDGKILWHWWYYYRWRGWNSCHPMLGSFASKFPI